MGGLTFANIALKPVTETDPIVDSCFSISENALIANLLHSRLETGREVDVKTTLAKDLSGGSRQTEFAVKEFARKKALDDYVLGTRLNLEAWSLEIAPIA